MKPIPQPPSRILALGACLLAVPAHAAVEIDPVKIQGTPTYPVLGTLLAIDEPASIDTTTTFRSGPQGPDWPEDADDGFSVLTGAQITCNEWRNNMWEPDNTPDTGDNVSYMNNKPGESVTYTFDLPDGAIIHGVYATWANQNNSGSGHFYTYDEGTPTTYVRPAANSTGNLVLQWTALDLDTYNGNFQRIFAGDIEVSGGDGFVVTWTQGTSGFPYTDAVVVDYSIPDAYWDTDGTTAGSGGPTPSGTWDGSATNWDATAADGTGAAAPWNPGDMASFSAGNDATGAYNVTVDGQRDISGLFFVDGDAILLAGTSPELRLTADSAVSVFVGNTATVNAPFTEDVGGRQLTKSGAGSLVLNADNSGVTGGTVIAGGSVEFASSLAIPGTGENVTVNSGAAILFGSGFGAGNIPTALADRVVAASEGAIAVDGYAAENFDFDTPGLTAASLGAVGNVSYSGTLTPSGGIYRLGGGGGALALSSALPVDSDVHIVSPGSVQLAGNSWTLDALTGAADGLLENASVTPAALTVGNANASTTYSGTLADGTGGGALSLVKEGTGTFTLAGTNTYTGGTTLNDGALSISSASNLGDASGGVAFNADAKLRVFPRVTPTLGHAFTLNNSAIADFDLNDTGFISLTITGPVIGNGGLSVTGDTSSLRLENSANTFTGPINIAGKNTFLRVNSLADSTNPITFLNSNTSMGFEWLDTAAAPLVLNDRQLVLNTNVVTQLISSASTPANTISINSDLHIPDGESRNQTLRLTGNNTGDNQFGGNLTDGINADLAINHTGGGNWGLSGTNTYSGRTLIQSSGKTLSIRGSQALSPNTSLDMWPDWGHRNPGLGLFDDGVGSIALNKPVNVRLSRNDGWRQEVKFIVGNNGGATTGSTVVMGDLNLNDVGINGGGPFRNRGFIINVEGSDDYRLQFGSVGLSVVGDTGYNHTFNPTTAPLTIAGGMKHYDGNAASKMFPLELSGTATGNLISGAISDPDDFPGNANAVPLQLIKSGSSEWTLSGANSFTGGTTMSGGTLTVDGSLADSSMTVSDGTVDGSGTLIFGPTDQVVTSGTGVIDLTGLTVEGSGLTDPVYIIIDSTGGGSYSGTFATVNVPGYTVNYDYDGFGTQVALEQAGGGSPFDSWATRDSASGVTFEGDENGDGVADGLAFLLGADNPNVDAAGLLPAVEETAGSLKMTFSCLAAPGRAPAVLDLEWDGDLAGPWTSVVVPDVAGNTNPSAGTGSVAFTIVNGTPNGEGDAILDVEAVITDAAEAAGGKLFGRLKGAETAP